MEANIPNQCLNASCCRFISCQRSQKGFHFICITVNPFQTVNIMINDLMKIFSWDLIGILPCY